MRLIDLDSFRHSIHKELFSNILPYWSRLQNDDGFVPALDSRNQPIPNTDLGLVMVSRLLWSYSRAYALFGDQNHLDLAEHAKHVLLTKFADTENGGFYWNVSQDGQFIDTRKQCYGQAFCIYAFSEHYAATKSQDSLDRAHALFRLIEEKAWDPKNGGYLESFDADWTPLEKMQLSPVDLEAPKTMNNHLHIIEAFANLQRVDPSEMVEKSCRRVLRVIADRIILSGTPRFGLFYDMEWNLIDPVVSPGHDIEGSWLLYEAAEILDDKDLIEEIKQVAIGMAELVLKTGIDPDDSGIYDEFHVENPQCETKSWWPQAEGVVGFFNAYQLSGDLKFLHASFELWNYIQKFIVDKENGEWVWGRNRDGSQMDKEKAGPWKSAYHNSRACIEMINRIDLVSQK